MIRKQLYLTPEINRDLKILARRRGQSIAQIVREILTKSLKTTDSKEAPADFLLKMAAKAGNGPGDLSANLISYLYGSKSPNYGKNKKIIR